MGKLTVVQIRNTKSTEKSYRLSDEHGLYFYVSKTGNKTGVTVAFPFLVAAQY